MMNGELAGEAYESLLFFISITSCCSFHAENNTFHAVSIIVWVKGDIMILPKCSFKALAIRLHIVLRCNTITKSSFIIQKG